MNSLEVGKEVFSLLSNDSRLTALVGNKIYPVIVEKETTFPFIVYKRSNVIPDYIKDLHLKDEVIIDIICVSNDYAEGIEIAGIVRDILEDNRIQSKGIQSIKLESATEDYTDDAYVQTLGFNLTITK